MTGGLGVRQDWKKAFELYSLAAAQGYGMAQSNLGKMYETEEEFGRIQKKHSICICPPRSRERPTAKTTGSHV